MQKFSTRYKFDPRDPAPAKLEDAPTWVRISYLTIIEKLTYIDQDSRYRNSEDKPLGIKSLTESFCAIIRQEPENDIYDSFHCDEVLKYLIKTVDWFYFYDFVEFVGRKLRDAQDSRHYNENWRAKFGLSKYIFDVNSVFSQNKVAWHLDSHAKLSKVHNVLDSIMQKTEEVLSDGFEAAREHYKKASRFLYEDPVDPENCIKEIVSAIESVGKVFYPKSSTLGAVIKGMKGDEKFPTSLVDLLDKFYILSNSEPAIRHGGTKKSNLSLHDAELCFHIGVSLIRYFLAKHGKTT